MASPTSSISAPRSRASPRTVRRYARRLLPQARRSGQPSDDRESTAVRETTRSVGGPLMAGSAEPAPLRSTGRSAVEAAGDGPGRLDPISPAPAARARGLARLRGSPSHPARMNPRSGNRHGDGHSAALSAGHPDDCTRLEAMTLERSGIKVVIKGRMMERVGGQSDPDGAGTGNEAGLSRVRRIERRTGDRTSPVCPPRRSGGLHCRVPNTIEHLTSHRADDAADAATRRQDPGEFPPCLTER